MADILHQFTDVAIVLTSRGWHTGSTQEILAERRNGASLVPNWVWGAVLFCWESLDTEDPLWS